MYTTHQQPRTYRVLPRTEAPESLKAARTRSVHESMKMFQAQKIKIQAMVHKVLSVHSHLSQVLIRMTHQTTPSLPEVEAPELSQTANRPRMTVQPQKSVRKGSRRYVRFQFRTSIAV